MRPLKTMRIMMLSLLATLVLPATAQTWHADQLIGLNANPQDDWDKTWIYRNVALQGRGFAPLSDPWSQTLQVPLKSGSSDPNVGYPVAGSSFNFVAASNVTKDNAGTYQISVKGNNLFINTGGGSLTTPIYDAVSNRTTATLTIPSNFSGGLIAFQWNNVTADFGELKVMQPGYLVGDTQLLTPAAEAHYARARVIRGMDRLKTNIVHSPNWAGSYASKKHTPLGYQHSLKGVFDLAKFAGDAHPWVNIPAQASDDYIEKFLGVVNNLVRPNTVAIVEYSNEPWNMQFPQHWTILEAMHPETGTFVGHPSATHRVVSLQRTGTTITVQLSHPHGKQPGDQVYQHVDACYEVPAGLKPLAAGTSGSTLVFSGPSGPNNLCVNTTGLESYVHTNPASELVAPLTSWGAPNAYATAYGAKAGFEIRKLRTIHTTAVAAGVRDRIRIVKGMQLGVNTYERRALAFAEQKYGNLDWLFADGGGLSPALYLTPDDPVAMTTPDAVLAQLEADYTVRMKLVTHTRNALLAFGQRAMFGYEGGFHTDFKTNDTAEAVRTVHRDDPRTPVLLAKTWKGWRDRGGDQLVYYHGGAGESFGGTGNNTWPLIEGTLTAYGNKVKDDFFTAQQTISSAPAGIAGVTSGTILFKDVIEAHEGLAFYNDMLEIPNTIRVNRYAMVVTSDSAGTYTVALDAASHLTGDTVELFVDGTLVASGTLPQHNIWDLNSKPGQALSAQMHLTAGHHFVEVRLGTTRSGVVGLYRVRFN